MAAPQGNQFWKARSSHGRQPIFKDADHLWAACCEYFEWVEANPLLETQYKQAHGEPVPVVIPKMRAMTISGLCIFLDISDTCWAEYRKRDDFNAIVTRVERIIYDQKFTGAAADQLNVNIIARELGLSDKRETDHRSSDGSMTPTREARDLTDEELAAIVAEREKG